MATAPSHGITPRTAATIAMSAPPALTRCTAVSWYCCCLARRSWARTSTTEAIDRSASTNHRPSATFMDSPPASAMAAAMAPMPIDPASSGRSRRLRLRTSYAHLDRQERYCHHERRPEGMVGRDDGGHASNREDRPVDDGGLQGQEGAGESPASE